MAAPASTQLCCAQGSFHLQRYPRRTREPLQAWCSADLLLLNAAADAEPALVVNDDHGALSIPLQAAALWTDSALSQEAIRLNCADNSVPCPRVIWSTEPPAGEFNQVFLRIPKQLPYFEYQLANLAARLAPGTRLYFAGMDKHLSRHTASLIERYFGEVERHRGQKKARLFSARQHRAAGEAADFSCRYYCSQVGGELAALPNVFSREQLDIGSRFLLDNLRPLQAAESAADLACGNGVLGIAAMQQGLASSVTFADESAMAVASARENCAAILGGQQPTRFHHGDGLLALEDRFDLILCNPPFHLGHTVDDFAGRRLIEQCADHLTQNGELLLVANRHLHYGPSLKKRFRRVQQLACNNKFIIWQAQGCC